jgi:hypothetical protein
MHLHIFVTYIKKRKTNWKKCIEHKIFYFYLQLCLKHFCAGKYLVNYHIDLSI